MSGNPHLAAALLILCNVLTLCPNRPLHKVMHPLSPNEAVVAKQRYEAGQKAEPPLTDQIDGFAWPDTPMGRSKPTTATSQ